MQEFHNKIEVVGKVEQRYAVIDDAYKNAKPLGWDWVSIQFGSPDRPGEKTFLDFYTSGSPKGLGAMSARHPDVVLECELFDITLPELHHVTIGGGIELASSIEEVSWEGESEDQESEQ